MLTDISAGRSFGKCAGQPRPIEGKPDSRARPPQVRTNEFTIRNRRRKLLVPGEMATAIRPVRCRLHTGVSSGHLGGPGRRHDDPHAGREEQPSTALVYRVRAAEQALRALEPDHISGLRRDASELTPRRPWVFRPCRSAHTCFGGGYSQIQRCHAREIRDRHRLKSQANERPILVVNTPLRPLRPDRCACRLSAGIFCQGGCCLRRDVPSQPA